MVQRLVQYLATKARRKTKVKKRKFFVINLVLLYVHAADISVIEHVVPWQSSPELVGLVVRVKSVKPNKTRQILVKNLIGMSVT